VFTHLRSTERPSSPATGAFADDDRAHSRSTA
jgi:hypothetical protein